MLFATAVRATRNISSLLTYSSLWSFISSGICLMNLRFNVRRDSCYGEMRRYGLGPDPCRTWAVYLSSSRQVSGLIRSPWAMWGKKGHWTVGVHSLSLSLSVSIHSLDFFCCCLCAHAELAYLSACCASEPRRTSPNPFPDTQHKGRCPYVMTTNLLSLLDPNARQENGPIAPAEVYGALMNGLLAARSSHCTFFIIMIITIERKLYFSLLSANPRCSVNMTHALGFYRREMTSGTRVYIWRTTFHTVFWPESVLGNTLLMAWVEFSFLTGCSQRTQSRFLKLPDRTSNGIWMQRPPGTF